jgi:hypothetical protein
LKWDVEKVAPTIRMEDESNSTKILNGGFHNTRPVRKPRTRWKDSTDTRNTRMEKTSF